MYSLIKLSFIFQPFIPSPYVTLFHGQSITNRNKTCFSSNLSISSTRQYIINSNNNDSHHDNSQDTVLSRRLFLLGTTLTTIVTTAGAYRFVVGEDLESRIQSRIIKQFPSLFPKELTPEERRLPLDPTFAKFYYDAIEQTAIQMNLLSSKQLHKEEFILQQRALGPFFQNQPIISSFSNPTWLNYLLYTRLHVICNKTSSQSRLHFVDLLSLNTLKGLKTKPLKQDSYKSKTNYITWLTNISDLLDELKLLGWISGYRIEDFDGEIGSLWQDEGRSTLTIFEFDPVTMQTAQLIGEEQYEEISPKLSSWIKLFLTSCGIKVSFEDYYLDNTYRPDPEQYRPTQFATQFDLLI